MKWETLKEGNAVFNFRMKKQANISKNHINLYRSLEKVSSNKFRTLSKSKIPYYMKIMQYINANGEILN